MQYFMQKNTRTHGDQYLNQMHTLIKVAYGSGNYQIRHSLLQKKGCTVIHTPALLYTIAGHVLRRTRSNRINKQHLLHR